MSELNLLTHVLIMNSFLGFLNWGSLLAKTSSRFTCLGSDVDADCAISSINSADFDSDFVSASRNVQLSLFKAESAWLIFVHDGDLGDGVITWQLRWLCG